MGREHLEEWVMAVWCYDQTLQPVLWRSDRYGLSNVNSNSKILFLIEAQQ